MAVNAQSIKLGTRGSRLALTQTRMVQDALARVFPEVRTEMVVIQTSGDWRPEHGETRLSESAGGKGQFAKEIEEALLAGQVDAGIHSMKDMESHLPDGLVIEHMLPREDPRDCFVFRNALSGIKSITDIPENFVIGTSSVRRAAFLKSLRQNMKIVPLRGNVQTRLEKLRNGEQGMDGTILALAGLKRLGLEAEAGLIADTGDMLPSAGQGAVGIEIRGKDESLMSIFSQISHSETVICVKAERAALAVLDGSCHTPIGAHATLEGRRLHLRVKVSSPDGREVYEQDSSHEIAGAGEAEKLGAALGRSILGRLPPGFLD